jgi:hypothetical protein
MSQYPSPYTPPGPHAPGGYNFDYYQPAAGSDPLGPARRASSLMYGLGGFIAAGGLCCAGVGAMLPQMLAQQPELLDEIAASAPGITPEFFQWIFVGLGALGLVVGIAMLVLAYFVRGGGLAPIVTAIVLTVLMTLYLLLNLVLTLVGLAGGGAAGAGGAGQAMLGLCFVIVPLGLFGLLLTWLIQAARSAGQVRAQREQQQAQFWQYQQQQHAYGQGYGAGGYAPPGGAYGVPPPPPPGAPPVPPPPPYRGDDDRSRPPG